MCDMKQWSSGKVPEAFVYNSVNFTRFSQFKWVYQFLDVTGSFLSGNFCPPFRSELEL